MTVLGDHAVYELAYQGITGDDADRITTIVGTFAEYTDPADREQILQKVLQLLKFKPLSALTNESAQWVDRSSTSGDRDEWQSKRDPDAWSHDGGETFYYASETGARYQATEVP